MTPSNRRALVLALVAVAPCLLVVGLLVRPHDEPPLPPTTAPTTSPAAAPTPTAATSAASDPAVEDGGLAPPAVVANPTASAVEFRWSATASTPTATDTYLVHVGPTAEEAEIADPISLTRATYSVKTASGTSVCLIAMVVRSGQTSPESPAVCGTAR